MTPQEAFEYSSQMADLWDDHLSKAEDDAWEAEMQAIRAAYQAEKWAQEEEARQDELAAAIQAEAYAEEQRKIW